MTNRAAIHCLTIRPGIYSTKLKKTSPKSDRLLVEQPQGQVTHPSCFELFASFCGGFHFSRRRLFCRALTILGCLLSPGMAGCAAPPIGSCPSSAFRQAVQTQPGEPKTRPVAAYSSNPAPDCPAGPTRTTPDPPGSTSDPGKEVLLCGDGVAMEGGRRGEPFPPSRCQAVPRAPVWSWRASALISVCIGTTNRDEQTDLSPWPSPLRKGRGDCQWLSAGGSWEGNGAVMGV